MAKQSTLSQYNRIAILRGYTQAVSTWDSRFGKHIELKTSDRSACYVRVDEIKSIEYCPWDSSRIFGQNFAIVTLIDGDTIKTGATVGEVKHSLKQL